MLASSCCARVALFGDGGEVFGVHGQHPGLSRCGWWSEGCVKCWCVC